MSTSRFARQAEQSLWADTLAAALYGCLTGRSPDERDHLAALWREAPSGAKTHFRTAAGRAIRFEDAAARRIASQHARHVFEFELEQRGIAVGSFTASQLQAAFDDMLDIFFDTLESGLPLGEAARQMAEREGLQP